MHEQGKFIKVDRGILRAFKKVRAMMNYRQAVDAEAFQKLLAVACVRMLPRA